jgi:hypothetical protein
LLILLLLLQLLASSIVRSCPTTYSWATLRALIRGCGRGCIFGGSRLLLLSRWREVDLHADT